MWPLGRLSVRRKFQILGLCLLCIGAFLALALLTRDARDQAVELLGSSAVRNQGGVLGALLSGALVSSLGLAGSWAVPLTLFVWGWNRLRVKPALEYFPPERLLLTSECGFGHVPLDITRKKIRVLTETCAELACTKMKT